MRRNMDTFESIARLQYRDNQKLITNERLVNGEFIANDYIVECEECEEEFFEPLNELAKDGGLPKTIKHYDMLGTAVKTQVEEFTQRPDTMSVVGTGEEIENDRYKVQKDYLVKWINEQLDLHFSTFLQSSGINPDQKFESEEEQQKFNEQIEAMRQERTPEEIGSIMKYQFKHFAEQWAENELQDQKERFKLAKLRRREFFDYLVVGRRARHLRVTNKGFTVEPVNYVNLFYHKAPNTEYIQRGDYAGKIFLETAAGVIDRYGQDMTEEEIRSFENMASFIYDQDKPSLDLFGNPVTYLGTDGNPYNKWLPTKSPYLNQIAPNLGMNWITNMGPNIHSPNTKMFVVTEAYWKSFKKIGRLCWENPETKLLEVISVDETFVVPSWVKVLKEATFIQEPEPNTIVWSWAEEIWQGTKINTYTIDTKRQAIYLNIKPCDYQGVSPYTMFGKTLPIVGQIANNLNTESSTQVDILKSYQFLYNVVMNKAFSYVETSLPTSVAIGANSIPNQKDWGGEDAMFKWMDSIQKSKVMLMDDSPSNNSSLNGGQFPRTIDLDNSPKVIQLLNVAAAIKQMGLSQVGITPQRMGDMEQINTATGINESLSKSYNATGSWFTDFWECEADILKQQLDVAQWVQSQKKDFTALISKGIISESFLLNNVDNFDLYDLRIYISNSQEELRKLNLFQKLAIENNTVITKMSTRMLMAGMTNADLILKVVKDEEEKMLKLQQSQQEYERQLEQAKTDLEKEKILLKKYEIDEKNKTTLKEAYIRAYGVSREASADTDASGVADLLEYDKFEAKAANDYAKLGLAKDKLALDREKETNARIDREREFELKFRNIELKEKQLTQTAKNVKILDKGKYNGK